MRKNKTFHIYNKKTLVIPTVFLFIFLFISLASASLQNFNSWAINNPDNLLTINSSRVTFHSNNTSIIAPVDFISKQFTYLNNNFIHNFTLNSSYLHNNGYGLGIYNLLKNNNTAFNTDDNDIFIQLFNASDNTFDIGIATGDSFNAFLYSTEIQKNVKYYITIERRNDILNLSIYNDVARTSLNSSTQSLDLHSLANPLGDYNYIHLVKTIDETGTFQLGDVYIEDFTDVDLTAKKGTSGNLLDLAFNYGTEDEPLWVRLLFSLVIVLSVSMIIKKLYEDNKK